MNTCQVCGRDIKATTGLIAHHGYKRPSVGWQSASCPGARYLPYEQSCERLREVIDEVTTFLARQQELYNDFLENPPTLLVRHEKRGSWGQAEKHEYTKPENFNPNNLPALRRFTYEMAYVGQRDEYKQIIHMTTMDLETMKQRLADWKPTVEPNGADIVAQRVMSAPTPKRIVEDW